MWLNPQIPAGLVIFTEKLLMENFIFCSTLLIKSNILQKKWTLFGIKYYCVDSNAVPDSYADKSVDRKQY